MRTSGRSSASSCPRPPVVPTRSSACGGDLPLLALRAACTGSRCNPGQRRRPRPRSGELPGRPHHDPADARRRLAFGCGRAVARPDGRPTGVLEFVWSSPPPTASLEPTLRTIGELCSQTLARVDAQELLARRSAALSELSGALAAAATSRDIQMCLMSHAAEPVGADHVNFVLHDPASGELVVQLPSSLDPAVAARYCAHRPCGRRASGGDVQDQPGGPDR